MIKIQDAQIQSNESNQSLSYEFLTPKIYEQLIKSHELAINFVHQLAELKNAPLPEALSTYTRDRKMQMYRNSADEILQLMDARLNKMIKNHKVKKNWSKDDISILIWLLSKYMLKNNMASHQNMNKHDWAVISSMIAGSTPHSCMFKFISLKKFKLAFYKWEKQEQILLTEIIKQLNGDYNWKNIAEKLYENGNKKKIFRTPKQCREHWSCYLDPKIRKGPWDRQQDKKLIKMVYLNKCIKKWSSIKKQFFGRTENALKNRYNLLLQKKRRAYGDKKLSQEQLIISILQNFNDEKQQTKSQNKRKCTQQIEKIEQNFEVPNDPLQNEKKVEEEQKIIEKSIIQTIQNNIKEDDEQKCSTLNLSGSPSIPLIPEEKRTNLMTYNNGFNYFIFNFPAIPQSIDPSNVQQINNWFVRFGHQ